MANETQTTKTRKGETMTSQQKRARIEELKVQAANIRSLQYNAAELRQAGQFGRLDREIRANYAEQDALLGR